MKRVPLKLQRLAVKLTVKAGWRCPHRRHSGIYCTFEGLKAPSLFYQTSWHSRILVLPLKGGRTPREGSDAQRGWISLEETLLRRSFEMAAHQLQTGRVKVEERRSPD
ncbi:hypothetical protein NDU88_000837 [Pleurodeles waltl]|uniref:Uncharacterized protein n=1 Tax=Pleurodeles waltl TaxID=8319 RepID=A0AAV7S845_PLEWA|nr:hypothetical protein NDU88_000837 [Pleurodeles waltl]